MLGVFLDIETSGLDPFTHSPLELAFVIVDLRTGNELGSYETFLSVTDEEWLARDLHSMFVNGILRDDLAKGQAPYQAGEVIEAIFTGYQITNDRAFFICQNPSFDRAFFSKIVSPYRQDMLHWPYHWLDLASMYWALRQVTEQSRSEFLLSVSKDFIAKSLSLPPEPKPHRAMNGVRHLMACYERLVGFPNS